MDRITVLEGLLKEDPDDPFNSYALALEYLKSDPKEAHDLFFKLIDTHPNYLPTYYPLSQLLIERQDPRTENIFKKGIEIARGLNETKTFKELSNAYNDWLFEQS